MTTNNDLLKNIPKILHLYWDRSPMSKLQVLTPLTFHNLNPDWKINLYLPKQDYNGNLKYIPDYNGDDYFNIIKQLDYVNLIDIDLKKYSIREDIHNILRSDIFRYNILYEKGGVWSDFDVIWLKPLTHLNKIKHANSINNIGITSCYFKNTCGHHSIGILLSAKKHKFYEEILKYVNSLQNKTGKSINKKTDFTHQAFGVVLWNRLYPKLIDLLKKYNDCLGIKYKTFYPYSIFELNKLYIENDLSYIDDNVICIHWFNGHQFTKNYINQNYSYKCSMTNIIKSCVPNFYDS